MKRKLCKLLIKARGHSQAYMKAHLRRVMREYSERAVRSGFIRRFES